MPTLKYTTKKAIEDSETESMNVQIEYLSKDDELKIINFSLILSDNESVIDAEDEALEYFESNGLI